jgi:hypothetical protein
MRRVRALSLVLALAAVGAPALAAAQAPASTRSRASRQPDDSVTRIVPRYPMRGSDALVSRDGHIALVLTDRSLVLQLTHEGIDHVTRRSREAEQDVGREVKSQPVARAVAALVGGLVRSIADRGLEYDLRDLADARVVDHRVVLRRLSGDEVFGNVEIDGTEVMESFDPAEARAFVARVRAAAQQAGAQAGRTAHD